ncbi:hypothetical protein, partial [Methylobacterium nigriterrae]|uniref:hypothetical protein n=1 Tax=Methylobacterium nigriterrae TaxID=3127512 RepID=UPI00301362FB
SFLHSASSSITPPSQEEQNARTRNTFKAEQAVADVRMSPHRVPICDREQTFRAHRIKRDRERQIYSASTGACIIKRGPIVLTLVPLLPKK